MASDDPYLDLVDSTQVAELTGRDRVTVRGWPARYVDYPQAVAFLNGGRVWRWSEIRAWRVRRWPEEEPHLPEEPPVRLAGRTKRGPRRPTQDAKKPPTR